MDGWYSAVDNKPGFGELAAILKQDADVAADKNMRGMAYPFKYTSRECPFLVAFGWDGHRIIAKILIFLTRSRQLIGEKKIANIPETVLHN